MMLRAAALEEPPQLHIWQQHQQQQQLEGQQQLQAATPSILKVGDCPCELRWCVVNDGS
jgi:hypothetical protein